jgi:dynein heavy chain
MNEGPEVFGLHENANISCAISETNALLDTALSLQPRSAGGEGKTWAETLDELAKEIASKVPKEFDIEKAIIKFPVQYNESMNTVLTQEMIRFNKLISTVTSSLADVQKAIKGLVVMSAELEACGNSMVIGKVPLMWAAVAYPSLKPLGSWTTDLLARISFLDQEWFEQGIAPPSFWISGFFFAQAFITGALQNFARKYKTPIDQCEFDFEVLTPSGCENAKTNRPEDGVYVHGLYLEGARWDVMSHAIDESHPRELYVLMPNIWLVAKKKDEVPLVEGIPAHYTGHLKGTAHVYMCPVYRTSFRQGTLSTTGHSTNFVMFIRLPMLSEHKQKWWCKRGCALLTQLDT